MSDKESNIIELKVGHIAPDFMAEITNPDGLITSISFYKFLQGDNPNGKPTKVLLVFYPGDDTPGCTKQLCDIRDLHGAYQKHGVTILGVNQADKESHYNFIQKYNFPFGIIIDKDKKIRESYGAIKKFFKNYITKRGVFLVDTDAKILLKYWGQQDNQKILDLLANN